MSQLSLQPPRVPLTDPNTGIITREWYRFFSDTFTRIGGTSALTPGEIDAALAAMALSIKALADIEDIRPMPYFDAASTSIEALAPVRNDQQVPDYLEHKISALAEEVTFLRRKINDIEQGYVL